VIDTGRLAARSVTFGGLAASLIANLLHAQLLGVPADIRGVPSMLTPTPVSAGPGLTVMIGSALPPLFLLGAVEVVIRVRWRPGFWSWLVRILLIPIAGISFYISWLHMSALVLSWGSSPTEAFFYPIMIDVAMLLSAGAMMLEDRTLTSGRGPVLLGGPVLLAIEEAVRLAIEETGPESVRIDEEARRTPQRTGADPLAGPPAGLLGAVLSELTGPPIGPSRTPSADPRRTADLRPPAPAGSRVDQLLPVARPIVEADPEIGWKPLAARLRQLGHSVGTKTARDLRAALPDHEDGEEVLPDVRGSDHLQARDQEGQAVPV
jgi:hypothetical protein